MTYIYYNVSMDIYISTIKESVMLFPLVALIISLPFFIWSYRKYGSFTLLRALILYSFSFYLLTAYFMVILPLPTIEDVAAMTGPLMDLNPGSFIINYLKSRTLFSLFEPIFNILILIPFGIYARYYFRYSLKKTILLAFLLSLFFELTQLSGLYGIYPRPYRLFSVDDLILNTLGGIVGYAIAPLFMKLLPSRECLDEKSYEKGERVSLLRRAVALFIDYIILVLLMGLVSYGMDALGIRTLGLGKDDFALIVNMICVFIYFIIICYFLKGQTVGKAIVRIRVVRSDKTDMRPSFWSLIKRYVILYYFICPVFYLLFHLRGTESAADKNFLLGELIVVFSVCILFAINFLYALLSRRHRLIYETLSSTVVISTVQENEKETQIPSENQ